MDRSEIQFDYVRFVMIFAVVLFDSILDCRKTILVHLFLIGSFRLVHGGHDEQICCDSMVV